MKLSTLFFYEEMLVVCNLIRALFGSWMNRITARLFLALHSDVNILICAVIFTCYPDFCVIFQEKQNTCVILNMDFNHFIFTLHLL
jgi:hypothetical protein